MPNLDIIQKLWTVSRDRTKPSPIPDPPNRILMDMKKHKLAPIVTGKRNTVTGKSILFFE